MGKIPGINHLHAIRTLEKAGFRVVREGKHTVMSDGERILTIRDTPRSTPSRWVELFGMPGWLSKISASFSDHRPETPNLTKRSVSGPGFDRFRPRGVSVARGRTRHYGRARFGGRTVAAIAHSCTNTSSLNSDQPGG